MTHREKVEHFLAEMSHRGVKQHTAAPPAWRLMWKLGLEVPPPHFVGFLPYALVSGLTFGSLWGLSMWFVLWRPIHWPIALTVSLLTGLAFGIIMAAYYRRSAAKLGLKSWEQYPA